MDEWSRRRALRSGVAGLLAGLGGCLRLGTGSDGGGTTDDGTTAGGDSPGGPTESPLPSGTPVLTETTTPTGTPTPAPTATPTEPPEPRTETETRTRTRSRTRTTTPGGRSDTVRVGVLQPLTGQLKYYGQQAVWGFASGLAYKTDTDPPGGVAGTGEHVVRDDDVTYELHVRDTELNPDVAVRQAAELVESDDVDVLFGAASSASAERVITSVTGRAKDVPFLVGPAAATSITGESNLCSEMVFRASETTATDARTGGTYVADETDVEAAYLLGADYSFGRSVVRNYRRVLEDGGVDVVGERFLPLGYEEFDEVLDRVVDEGADAVVAGFTVRSLPQLLVAALDYDLRVFAGWGTQITASVVGDTLRKVLGEPLTAEKIREAGIGPFSTRYHWNQYDNPINEAFVEAYADAYGRVPDLFTSGTFTAASALVQAVRESGTTAGPDLAEGMRGMTVGETPKGEDAYRFQEYNNQARSPATVAYPVPTPGEVSGRWDASIAPGAPEATVDADRTTVPADSDLMNCSL